MSNHHPPQINDAKVQYRMQHFKDFQNTLITVNGGIIVAILAYMSTINGGDEYFSLAFAGIAGLGTTIFLQIVILFQNYIFFGLIFDGKDETAKNLGKRFSVPLIMLSLLLTPVGFVLLFVFLTKTI